MAGIDKKHKDLDRRLVLVASSIKLLSTLTWPQVHQEVFLAAWRSKNPHLPKVDYHIPDLNLQCAELLSIARECDADDRIGSYLRQTALSYYYAGLMLQNLATPQFLELSTLLYGGSQEKLGRLTNVSFADEFISITDDISASTAPSESANCMLQTAVIAELREAADSMFGHGELSIVADRRLTSKAAAGGERVRIRDGATFTNSEVLQLIQHEIFVHAATARNGRAQPHLKSLGLGSPRTTCTQEGLATFAELITATMDLSRLRRIALRIKAIDVACSGGDFIDVFRFFLHAGQSEVESFQSCSRIFRGADPKGINVFTKDVVYLKGLFSVHTFLRKAIEQRKIHYPEYLFIGRLTVGDVLTLEDCIDREQIALPKFKPRWITNRDCLAAYLSYAAFANRLSLESVKLEDFISPLELPAA
jgi:uncharacterized protein (TIGR02421 family)